MKTADIKTPSIRFPSFSDDWKQHNLGDLYSERNEKGYEGLPILSVSIHSGVSDGELSEDQLGKNVRRSEDKSTYKHVYSGDLVFNMMRAWQGAIGVTKCEGMVSPAYISAIPNEDVFPLFMDYSLRRKETISQINNLSYGVTDFRKRLYWDSFIDIICSLPSVEEQKAIFELFKTIDNTISLHQRKCDELKKYKKGLLQQMFPLPGERIPRVRFPGFTAPWEQHKLGDLSASFEYGLNAAAKEYDGKNKYIRITDIDDDSRSFIQENVTSPDADLSESEKYKLIYGDILFARTGASVGKTYIYRSSDGLVYYAGFLIRARIKSDFNPEFVFQNTLTSRYSKFITLTSMRSGQPGVNAQEYSQFEIMMPCRDEQDKISDCLNSIDNLITLHQRKCDELRIYKKGLLQKMFV